MRKVCAVQKSRFHVSIWIHCQALSIHAKFFVSDSCSESLPKRVIIVAGKVKHSSSFVEDGRQVTRIQTI